MADHAPPSTTALPNGRIPFHVHLDGAPLNRTHLFIWLLSAAGVALDGFDFFIIGAALPLIKAQFNPSAWEVGAIGAAAVLGAALGAFTFGPITDKLGRKLMYVWDLVFFVLFSLCSAFAWDVWSLVLFRFLLGVGIGADYPISATYVSELMPSRLRGRLVSSTIGFQAVGMIFGVVTGLFCYWIFSDVPVQENPAWRWMLGIAVVPAAIVLVLRTMVPDSPRWLAAHGYIEKAKKAAKRLVGPEGIERTDFSLAPQTKKSAAITQILAPNMLRRTMLACIPWFLMDIATYGVGVYTPILLASMFGHDPHTNFIAEEIKALEGAAFVDLFLAVGFVIAICLIERMGRIKLQLIGFAAMTVGLGLLVVSDQLPGGAEQHLPLVFAGFIIFNTMMNAGPNTTTYVLPAEVFPTKLRASGHGIAAAAGKAGATVGLFLLPVLQTNYGLGVTMGVVAAASALGFVVTWLCQIETTGRSLEEFDQHHHHHHHHHDGKGHTAQGSSPTANSPMETAGV